MVVNAIDAEFGVYQSDSTNSDSLSNHWPMNEVRGTTANDVQGSADGTINGVGLNFESFDNLPVYNFISSESDYISLPSSYDTGGSISEITVAAWIKADNFSSSQTVIGFDSDEYWGLSVNSNDHVVWHTTDSGGSTHSLSGSEDVADGNWHLIAGVYDTDGGPDKRIFVDGTTDNTANNPHQGNSLGSGTTRFGFIGVDSNASSEDGTNDGDFYDGQMAHVFIYNRPLSNAELTDIYNAGATAVAPDFTIPASDITSVDASQRIDKRRDAGRITIENNDGTYDSDSNEINSGDLLRFRTRLQGESALTHQWSAMVETVLYEQIDANRMDLRIEATDFVFGIISNRIIENTYEGVSIFNIVDDVMSGSASEVYTDRVENISKTVDTYPRGTNVLDFLNEMAGKGDAVMSNRDRSLVFEKASQAEFAFELKASDKSTHIIRKEGDSIINRARVDGGQNFAVDDEQTNQTTTTTVTESSRVTHQLTTRKATIDRIELYTDPTQNQIDRDENLRIRIQKDDGGSPVSVGDFESDVVSKEITTSELTQGGLTPFLMPDHKLVDPDPWMIIESSGSGGIDIGVDGSNNPNYKAYFQFRVSTVSGAKGSEDSYRLREVRRFHGQIRSRDAAKEISTSMVRHNKEPNTFIEFPAESKRAHNVKVGDEITVDETNTSGDFLITSKEFQYEGLNLFTTIEAQLVSTI